MKNLKYLLVLLLVTTLMSCEYVYPKYSLTTIEVVPDSLKAEYSTFITETIRASNQHLTAGDYEDVEDVVYATKRVADRIYCVDVVGLKIEINSNYYDDIKLLPKDMGESEKEIFNNLRK